MQSLIFRGNEGESIIFSIQTENVDSNQLLYWQIKSEYVDSLYNMSNLDFNTPMYGSSYVDDDGNAVNQNFFMDIHGNLVPVSDATDLSEEDSWVFTRDQTPEKK